MSGGNERSPRIPPRWFVRSAWYAHRALYRVTGGRVGLRRAGPGRFGTMRLTTTGRRSGQQRSVILAYLQDGPDLVTMAMNGWSDGEPAWWLNLRAHPDASVVTRDGPRAVRAHAADGPELARLWDRWREIEPGMDAYTALRSTPTAIVVLEPAPRA